MLSNFHITYNHCIDANIRTISNAHSLSFLNNSLVNHWNFKIAVLMVTVRYIHIG